MIPIPAAVYKYIAIVVAIGMWTYGNRWQAVQAYKHTIAIAAAAEQAKLTESHRRDDIKATNAKDTYDRDLQNIRIDSKRLDAVLDRLHNTASADCAPDNTSGASKPAAPQFEWGS